MAITVTHKTTDGTGFGTFDTADTASVTLDAGKTILAWCTTSHASSSAAAKPTPASVNGNTWAEVDERIQGAGNRFRGTLWRTVLSSSYTGAVTIDVSATMATLQWSIVQLEDADTGNNGADGVIQSADNGSNSGLTTLTVTLAAFSDAGNATFGFFFNAGSASVYTEGSGFAILGQVSAGRSIMSEWRNDNDTSVDCTWTTAQVSLAVAIEVAPAAAADERAMAPFMWIERRPSKRRSGRTVGI